MAGRIKVAEIPCVKSCGNRKVRVQCWELDIEDRSAKHTSTYFISHVEPEKCTKCGYTMIVDDAESETDAEYVFDNCYEQLNPHLYA